jgi:hypothetical protein
LGLNGSGIARRLVALGAEFGRLLWTQSSLQHAVCGGSGFLDSGIS